MKTQFIEDEILYDGHQLKSLFAYMNYGISGNSILSWIGPCEIPSQHMVDGEDLREGSPIRGHKMLHFIIEVFDTDLIGTVALQRLFAAIVKDIAESLLKNSPSDFQLRRDGDDIYWQDKKFSISVASKSATSTMVHFAVNISNENTPVATCSLEDFQISPKEFSKAVLDNFKSEFIGIREAAFKVRPLGHF